MTIAEVAADNEDLSTLVELTVCSLLDSKRCSMIPSCEMWAHDPKLKCGLMIPKLKCGASVFTVFTAFCTLLCNTVLGIARMPIDTY
jgi:hypothetical protein